MIRLVRWRSCGRARRRARPVPARGEPSGSGWTKFTSSIHSAGIGRRRQLLRGRIVSVRSSHRALESGEREFNPRSVVIEQHDAQFASQSHLGGIVVEPDAQEGVLRVAQGRLRRQKIERRGGSELSRSLSRLGRRYRRVELLLVSDRRAESRSRRRGVESRGFHEAAQSLAAARGVPDGASRATG